MTTWEYAYIYWDNGFVQELADGQKAPITEDTVPGVYGHFAKYSSRDGAVDNGVSL